MTSLIVVATVATIAAIAIFLELDAMIRMRIAIAQAKARIVQLDARIAARNEFSAPTAEPRINRNLSPESTTGGRPT